MAWVLLHVEAIDVSHWRRTGSCSWWVVGGGNLREYGIYCVILSDEWLRMGQDVRDLGRILIKIGLPDKRGLVIRSYRYSIIKNCEKAILRGKCDILSVRK